MRKILIRIAVMMALLTGLVLSSCVKGKKSCKAAHKKVNAMRKSGQIKM